MSFIHSKYDNDRQALINGSFQVNQEAITSVSGINGYFCDMWAFSNGSAASINYLRDTDSKPKFTVGTADTSVAAADYLGIYTAVEGYNFTHYVGETVTLSFEAESSLAGTYCIAFRNNGNDRSYIAEYTLEANVKKRVDIPITFDYSGGTNNYTNGVGISLFFTLMCGTTFQTTADTWQTGNYFATSNQVNWAGTVGNTFKIYNVQINKGTIPLPFFNKSYLNDLWDCKRYYQIITREGRRCHQYQSGANMAVYFSLAREMRTTPSVSFRTGMNTQGTDWRAYQSVGGGIITLTSINPNIFVNCLLHLEFIGVTTAAYSDPFMILITNCVQAASRI